MKIIYYPRWRLRFFCQDKNASTTFYEFFARAYEGSPLIYWDKSTRHYNTSLSHSWQEVVDAEADLEFTIVRNTWDRIVSLYSMLRDQYTGKEKGLGGPFHSWFAPFEQELVAIMESPDPFDSFVSYIARTSDARCDSHWQSQHTHLPFHSPVFRVVRLERLNDDISNLIGAMSPIDMRAAVPVNVRRADSADYRVAYRAATRELIRQRYLQEISIFGFEF